MSHFYTLVLVPQNSLGAITNRKEIENKIADLMEQYSENKEVEEYDTECSCVNSDSVADKECESCKGTGVYKTTYNPDSRWDWYSVGGRWSGALSDYDPATDPDNIEKCFICRGTGMRNDDLGKKARKEDPSYTCNGCGGKGKSVKWPTQWTQHDGDMQPTDKVIQMIKKDDKYCPHALVTPNGKWHERGHMHMFCVSSEDKDQDVWKNEVIRLLKIFKNSIAVVVDCHI